VIFSEYLNGQKARIKLMLCLGVSKDKEALQNFFRE